ncbi:MAG: class I SAM-dependent methyltransferase [Planctomycetota bacterium]
MTSWYDHPQYFDMGFREETPMEVAFFEQAFARFADGPVKSLLEPGCGTGRLVVAMSQLGYNVTGLDLSEPMLGYLRKQLRRKSLEAGVVQGDMTDMRLGRQFDAAFCTFNTFRHLMTEQASVRHLRDVAEHVRPGGLYILGFHCLPWDADPESTERWTATAGGTRISVTFKVIDFDADARTESIRVSIKATKRSGKIERVRSEFPLRTYSPQQAKALLRKVSDVFEIAEVYNFAYDIEEPEPFDKDSADVLFILKRTG